MVALILCLAILHFRHCHTQIYCSQLQKGHPSVGCLAGENLGMARAPFPWQSLLPHLPLGAFRSWHNLEYPLDGVELKEHKGQFHAHTPAKLQCMFLSCS